MLIGNIFTRDDKPGVGSLSTSGSNRFADVLAPTDPTPATDTQLRLLDGTLPVYSLDHDDLHINGADTTVAPPNGTDFPGTTPPNAPPPSGLRSDNIG